MPVEKPDYPGTMELYMDFKWPEDIPRKDFNDLTPEQQQRILAIYRFCGFKPGTYQGITGRGLMG